MRIEAANCRIQDCFLGEEDIAWLAQFRNLHLSDEEAKALIVVREAGAIDNATYRELNKVDALVASGALRRLRDAGLLTQKGRGSATYYVPTDRLGAEGGVLPTNPEALPTNPAPEEETVRRTLLAELPGDLAARVGALGRRSTLEEAQAVIVEVCRLRAWRAEELALLLHRNSRHVRNTYLRPLLRDGRLSMTHPDEPNDPQQAYRALISPAPYSP